MAFEIKNGILKKYIHDGKTTIIEVPDGVTIIGKLAFFDIKNNFDESNIEEIKLPDGVKIIEEGAFSNLRNLKKIYIPDTVEEIGWRAFYYCISLEQIWLFNKRYDVSIELLEPLYECDAYIEFERECYDMFYENYGTGPEKYINENVFCDNDRWDFSYEISDDVADFLESAQEYLLDIINFITDKHRTIHDIPSILGYIIHVDADDYDDYDDDDYCDYCVTLSESANVFYKFIFKTSDDAREEFREFFSDENIKKILEE